MSQSIKGVLFDNDGTLVDTYELLLVSFRHTVEKVLGHSLPDGVLMRGVGTPLADQMYDFTDDPAVAERLLVEYRAYNHQIHDRMIHPFPGMADALARMKDAGLALGVVTSKLHQLAWHGLEVCDLARYFDFLIGPDDWPEHKPDPGPVLHGADLMGLLPAQCAYVGDSPYDMHAGKAAGTFAVGVLWGMFDREALAVENPDAFCETPAELADLICGA